MDREKEPHEVQIARDVLRRMLRGRSLSQLSLQVGKARNYLARLLNGDIPFTFSAACDALHAATLAPADYFGQVALECSGAEEDVAVRDLVESFGAPPGLRRIETRVDEINERLIQLASKLAQA
jgi:hypothetical protein